MTWWWKHGRVAVLGIAILAAGCGQQQPPARFSRDSRRPRGTADSPTTADERK